MKGVKIMVYVIIAVVYLSMILLIAVVGSQHIGYDVPRNRPKMYNHEIEITQIEMQKTRTMWDK